MYKYRLYNFRATFCTNLGTHLSELNKYLENNEKCEKQIKISNDYCICFICNISIFKAYIA